MRKLTKWMGLIFCGVFLLSQLSLPASAALFKDIQGNWVQDKIEAWASKGIINGYPDGTFRPTGEITRAEFIKLVNKAFGFTKGKAIKFPDVKAEQWFFSDLQIAYNQGYISGYEDGTFRPANKITRQEVAKVITSLLQLKENPVTTWSFADYDNMDTWARGMIGAVVDAKIMGGYSSGPYAGTFGGRRNITRDEVVDALWNAAEYKVDPPVTDLTVTSSSYRPSKLETVKDLYIQYPDHVDIRNLMVLGSIYVDSRVGGSTVTLTNVTCANNLVIDQGNWVLDSSEIKNLNVGYKGSTVTLKNKTTVETASVTRSATIEQSALSKGYLGIKDLYVATNSTSVLTLKGNFENVELNTADQNVSLASGKIENMSITRAGSEVTLSTGTVLNYVYVGDAARVIGPGKVRSASVEARNVVMQREPDTLRGSRTPSYLGDYTLTFLITDAASGKVMNGVTVTLNDINETAKTASNGQVRFNSIAGGTINYTVTMSGYQTVKASTKITDVNKVVELSMMPQGNYTAELTVQDSLTREVLKGATARLKMGNLSDTVSNTTGNNGKLWFYSLGNAVYTYTVSCPGYVTSSAASFTISNRDLVVSSPVRLVPTSLTISAEAVSGGKAVKSFSVKDPRSGEWVSTTNGSVTIRYLRAGTSYDLQVRADGFSEQSQRVTVADQATNTVKIPLNSDRVFDYSVTLSNGNGPVSGATVVLENTGWKKTLSSDAHGVVLFTDVPEAAGYTMKIRAKDHQDYDVSGIEISTTQTNRSVAVRLYTLRTVRFTYLHGDVKVSGAKIWLQSQTNKDVTYSASGVSNNAGVVSIANVPDGSYYVFAEHNTYTLQGDSMEGNAVAFTLEQGNTELTLQAKPRTIRVSIKVVDANAAIIRDQQVSVQIKRADGFTSDKLVTNAEGLVRFDLSVGKYEVQVFIKKDSQNTEMEHQVIGGGQLNFSELASDQFDVTVMVGDEKVLTNP